MGLRRPSWENEFTEFFLGRQRTLMRTAYAMLGNPAAAEDAVQATFVAIYARWPQVREGNPGAYARRTLVNTCISVWRSRRRELVTDRLPEQPVAADHLRAELFDALGQLPDEERAVIALRFLEDLSVRQVAQALELPEGTVKSKTSRALARLETSLAQPTEGK